jgi:phosphate regulon transcriptional regulator PhoB
VEKAKILIVEDEPDIAELVSYNLRKEGYETTAVSDGEEALRLIRKTSFDLIILDLMLPGIQGLDLCRIIRSDPATARLPIIMLTAKAEESDRVLGLETGADDYLPKPFGTKELIARVRALLRRSSEKAAQAPGVRLGDIIMDKDSYSATKGGEPIALSATEFKLFLYLAERKGRVFSRDQLLDAVWKDDVFVEPRTVDVHIRRLRTQIEDDPADPKYIKTKRGVGYYVEKDV